MGTSRSCNERAEDTREAAPSEAFCGADEALELYSRFVMYELSSTFEWLERRLSEDRKSKFRLIRSDDEEERALEDIELFTVTFSREVDFTSFSDMLSPVAPGSRTELFERVNVFDEVDA